MIAEDKLQEVHILATGTAASASDLAWLEKIRAEGGSGGGIANAIKGHMGAIAAEVGVNAVVAMVAKNGFGLSLSAEQTQRIVDDLIAQGVDSWAKLFDYCLELQGGEGMTLENRGKAADAFVAMLDKAGKAGWFQGAAVDGAVSGLLQNIGASSTSFNKGLDGLEALAANLRADGIRGSVVDGYVSGATVFVDANGNGLRDEGEWSGTTDESGNFVLPNLVAAGKVIAFGGIDIMTGKSFKGVLTAPAGATVVNPLTTLVEAMLSGGHAGTVQQATDAVQQALGLPEELDVLSYDPLAVLADATAGSEAKSAALTVQSAALQVANVITQTAAALHAVSARASLEGTAGAVAGALAGAMASRLANGAGTFDLSSAPALAEVVAAAAAGGGAGLAGQTQQLAQVTAASNKAAAQAATISELAQVAVVAQGAAADALAAGAKAGSLTSAVGSFTGVSLSQQVDSAKPGYIAPGVEAPTVPEPPADPVTPPPSTDGGGGTGTSSKTVWAGQLEGTQSAAARLAADKAAVTLKVDPAYDAFVTLTGFGADDTLQFNSGASALLAVSSAQGNVTLVTNLNGAINQIVLQGVADSEAIIYDAASFNALTVGDIVFTGGSVAPKTTNLDALGGTPAAPQIFNAAASSFSFTDSAARANAVRTYNFGSDDALTFAGGAVPAVSSQNGDVIVSVNNGGTVSSVTLVGVAAQGQIIHDLASFNALSIGDISIA